MRVRGNEGNEKTKGRSDQEGWKVRRWKGGTICQVLRVEGEEGEKREK